ncbi:MAG: permease prefix domain 1-containing protein, partial [Acidobacteria bacterium]|nr:permease prefix domain 1-containing protein [Acidobacteriota bacterium]
MDWKRFWRRKQLDDDFAAEVEAHLAHEIDDNREAGMSPEEARFAALRKFGNVTAVKEVVHEMTTLRVLESFWQDLRHGARLLRLSPAVAVVATLSLALGMGANAALFQLLDAVRLRSLPVRHPEELVEIQVESQTGRTGRFMGGRPQLTHAIWEQVRERQQ